jgi:hypothetical protein
MLLVVSAQFNYDYYKHQRKQCYYIQRAEFCFLQLKAETFAYSLQKPSGTPSLPWPSLNILHSYLYKLGKILEPLILHIVTVGISPWR